MSYRAFRKRVRSWIAQAGGDLSVRFSPDRESGRHYALCSDGTKITGNSKCLRMEVRWGSGHRAFTPAV